MPNPMWDMQYPEDYDDSPHGEQQSQIDYLERDSDDEPDPADFDDFWSPEFDGDDEPDNSDPYDSEYDVP